MYDVIVILIISNGPVQLYSQVTPRASAGSRRVSRVPPSSSSVASLLNLRVIAFCCREPRPDQPNISRFASLSPSDLPPYPRLLPLLSPQAIDNSKYPTLLNVRLLRTLSSSFFFFFIIFFFLPIYIYPPLSALQRAPSHLRIFSGTTKRNHLQSRVEPL